MEIIPNYKPIDQDKINKVYSDKYDSETYNKELLKNDYRVKQ